MKRAHPAPIRLNVIDRFINYIDPVRSARRIRARAMMNVAQDVGYISFGSSRKSMRGAYASTNSADNDILPKLQSIRASSRDLYMNAPVATGALRRARTNIVGYGLTLQPRIDREKLGLSDDAADAWENRVDREFDLWADSKFCDITRTQDFYGLQGLALLSSLMSGDCFVLTPYVKKYDFPYELCIKIIESDLVSNPFNLLENDRVCGGIEVDENGAPIAYHIQKTHPGATYPMYEWERVPAYGEGSGRRNVLHLFDKERPGQRRGVPMLAPVIEKLKQLTRLSESELMAAVVTSFFTAFIKTDLRENNPVNDGFAGTAETAKTPAEIPTDASAMEMGAGTIIDLVPGESVELADPKRPNGAFAPFFEAMVREIGSAIEIPFELLVLHFTASYSASRAALLEAWKFFLQRRAWLEREFCRPIYEEWLAEAVAKSRISAPGFFIDPAVRKAWCGSKWSGPGQGQLNPVQETEAAKLRVECGFSTKAKETAAIDGDNWYTMTNNRAREIAFEKSKGLYVDPNPVKPAPEEKRDDKNDDKGDREDE